MKGNSWRKKKKKIFKKLYHFCTKVHIYTLNTFGCQDFYHGRHYYYYTIISTCLSKYLDFIHMCYIQMYCVICKIYCVFHCFLIQGKKNFISKKKKKKKSKNKKKTGVNKLRRELKFKRCFAGWGENEI